MVAVLAFLATGCIRVPNPAGANGIPDVSVTSPSPSPTSPDQPVMTPDHSTRTPNQSPTTGSPAVESPVASSPDAQLPNAAAAQSAVLVLGDSFAQGWGVANRQAILESVWPGAISLAQTGVDTLDISSQLTEAADLIARGLVPTSVFISLGGNNLSFVDFAQNCIFSSCPELGDIKPTLATMTDELTDIYRQIDDLVNSPELIAQRGYAAQIFVTDYPLLLSPDLNLTVGPVQVNVAATAAAQISEIQLALNRAIAQAVADAGSEHIQLISVQDAFTGHRLGDATSFVSITLHPNAQGFETILTKVASAMG